MTGTRPVNCRSFIKREGAEFFLSQVVLFQSVPAGAGQFRERRAKSSAGFRVVHCQRKRNGLGILGGKDLGSVGDRNGSFKRIRK